MNSERAEIKMCMNMTKENKMCRIIQKNVFLVKEALEIPFEDVMENALQRGVISKEEKEGLLGKDVVLFPGLKFIDTSVEYIDDIVQTKMEWKAAREEVEDENDWLNEIK
jgi:hypothetical protein